MYQPWKTEAERMEFHVGTSTSLTRGTSSKTWRASSKRSLEEYMVIREVRTPGSEVRPARMDLAWSCSPRLTSEWQELALRRLPRANSSGVQPDLDSLVKSSNAREKSPRFVWARMREVDGGEA